MQPDCCSKMGRLACRGFVEIDWAGLAPEGLDVGSARWVRMRPPGWQMMTQAFDEADGRHPRIHCCRTSGRRSHLKAASPVGALAHGLGIAPVWPTPRRQNATMDLA